MFEVDREFYSGKDSTFVKAGKLGSPPEYYLEFLVM